MVNNTGRVGDAAGPVKIIANPRADHGRGERYLRQLQEIIRQEKLGCEVCPTRYPGHATELARQMAESGESRVAVMGGDGTIAEVFNGLVGRSTKVGLISTGTGNDVARSLGLPIRDLRSSLHIALTGPSRPMDIGWDRDRCFVSVLSVGFPCQVAEAANRRHWLKGSAAFFFGVYSSLYRLEVLPLRIVLDELTLEVECSAVLVHNTPFTGGGLKMAPSASSEDGLLDIVVIGAIGKLDAILSFPGVYRGRHVNHPCFSVYRSRSVELLSEKDVPKACDGDVVGVLPATVRILPGAVQVIRAPDR